MLAPKSIEAADEGVCRLRRFENHSRELGGVSSVYSANLFDPREIFMVPVITANALLVWFVWGFFMALGWVLGTAVIEWVLGMVWRNRPARPSS